MRCLLMLIGFTFLTMAVVSAANTYTPPPEGFSFFNPEHVFGFIQHIELVPTGVGVAFNFGTLVIPNEVGWDDGDEDMGGFTCVAYLGIKKEIASYPTIASDPASFDQMVDLVGNYAMVQGKHFYKILCTPGSAQLNPESQGENVGSKSFKLGGSFIVPGFKNKNRALARMLNNGSGVLIFLDDSGERISIGTEGRPVTFKPKGKSGGKASDSKEFVYDFETDSHIPGFSYNGTIILDAETLPAIS